MLNEVLLMRKSTVIAKCLVNSNIIGRLEDAERSVQQVFLNEFPNSDFFVWNQNINEKAADDIIRNVGLASRINVKKFIQELW